MAKGRLPASKRHVHDWSYEPSLFFSVDDAVVWVGRFCMTCGSREFADTTWRCPEADELRDMLAAEARRDANPREDLEAEYNRGFCEAMNQVQAALTRLSNGE